MSASFNIPKFVLVVVVLALLYFLMSLSGWELLVGGAAAVYLITQFFSVS